MAPVDVRIAEAEAALATLNEAVGKSARSVLERDGAILRLIYTFEVIWKASQQLLAQHEGVAAASPNATIRAVRPLAGCQTTTRGPHWISGMTAILRCTCIAAISARRSKRTLRRMQPCWGAGSRPFGGMLRNNECCGRGCSPWGGWA